MKLLYFSWIRERLGMGEELFEPDGNISTLGDLVSYLKTRGEAFEAIFQHDGVIRIAIDHEHVDDLSTSIADAKEIAFFPPMTGG